jgi:hypothetical protein
MVTCKQRTEARNKTLPQLQAVGLQPIIFKSECEPASIRELNSTALKAIKYAASTGEDMLYVEDDIDLNAERFKWALENRKDAVTYYYLNDFDYRLKRHYGNQLADKINKRKQIPLNNYEIQDKFELFGTQCVRIPARLMSKMTAIMSDDSQPGNPWDGRLLNWLQGSRERAYCVLPHPVQHRQDETAWDRKRKIMRSMSYDLPTQ